ncbi:MAG: hypothetical protein GX808_04790, partial [Syntrophomonadaceae bacterium]|nr:hypothetical protein [Syntrophomonadaceae bacterium]
MKKRRLALLLIVFLMNLFFSEAFVNVNPVYATNISDEIVFTKQNLNECPLASTVSMLRRRAIIDNKENWNSVYTYEKIKNVAWDNTKGMYWNFDFPDKNGYSVKSPTMDLDFGLNMGDVNGKKKYLVSELKKHPEGIAVYIFFLKTPKRDGHLKSQSGKTEQHVVLLTDYDEKKGTFYCFDPSNSMPKGRIELKDSSLPKYIKNAGYWKDSIPVQDQIISYVAQTWMITNVSGGGSNTKPTENAHSTHTYNDIGYCTIGGEKYPISLQQMTATTYQAINDNTPIRWEPYQPEPIIERLSKDIPVTVMASGKNAKGNLWYKLNDNTWVYSENVKKSSKPTTPTGLVVQKASSTTAKVSWNAIPGAYYEAEYKSPNTNNQWVVDKDYGDNKATSYTAVNMGNHTYYFRVRAVNSAGRSDLSNEVWYTNTKETISPAVTLTPPRVTATQASSTTAKVSWNAVSGTGIYYVVEYKSPNTNNAWVTDTDYKTKTATSYTPMNMGNHTYYFRVKAVNSAGQESEWSNIASYTHVKETAAYGTVTIKYSANGGNGAPSSHTTTKDSSGDAQYNLSTTRPTRSGYTFLGWRLENDTAYDIDRPGQGIYIGLGYPTSNTTLTYYAQWQQSNTPTTYGTVTIKYNA